jgi:hypothetical protein
MALIYRQNSAPSFYGLIEFILTRLLVSID